MSQRGEPATQIRKTVFRNAAEPPEIAHDVRNGKRRWPQEAPKSQNGMNLGFEIEVHSPNPRFNVYIASFVEFLCSRNEPQESLQRAMR
jgi:hypothetical protein